MNFFNAYDYIINVKYIYKYMYQLYTEIMTLKKW